MALNMDTWTTIKSVDPPERPLQCRATPPSQDLVGVTPLPLDTRHRSEQPAINLITQPVLCAEPASAGRYTTTRTLWETSFMRRPHARARAGGTGEAVEVESG